MWSLGFSEDDLLNCFEGMWTGRMKKHPSDFLTNVGKAAIISLSDTLRVEVAPDNIGITVAYPMFINTRLLDNMKTTTPWIGEVAAISFKNGLSSDIEAERLISAVEKGKLYVIPMLVGKVFWLNKRITPGLYYFLEALLHKHGLLKPMFYKLAHWGALSHYYHGN
jgi:hypothetical protein